MTYGPWTDEEKADYLEVKDERLGSLYATVRIPVTEPEARARYLSETLLDLGSTDADAIMSIASGKGRPAALQALERIAIEEFF